MATCVVPCDRFSQELFLPKRMLSMYGFPVEGWRHFCWRERRCSKWFWRVSQGISGRYLNWGMCQIDLLLLLFESDIGVEQLVGVMVDEFEEQSV